MRVLAFGDISARPYELDASGSPTWSTSIGGITADSDIVAMRTVVIAQASMWTVVQHSFVAYTVDLIQPNVVHTVFDDGSFDEITLLVAQLSARDLSCRVRYGVVTHRSPQTVAPDLQPSLDLEISLGTDYTALGCVKPDVGVRTALRRTC